VLLFSHRPRKSFAFVKFQRRRVEHDLRGRCRKLTDASNSASTLIGRARFSRMLLPASP